MKNSIKVGLRLKLDFLKDLWTFDWYFFNYGSELGHNYTTYYFVVLFIGLTLRLEK